MCLHFEFRLVMSVTNSHKNDVLFVFTPSCLWEGSCLIYDVLFVFTSSCLWEDSCLIYVICVCCLWEGSCLIYVICVCCLWEDSCLIYVICVCCLWEVSCLIYVICVCCLWEDSCLIYVICVCCLWEGSCLIYVISVCCIYWCLPHTDYMSNMGGVLWTEGTVYPSRTTGFTPGFWWGSCCSSFLVFCLSFVPVSLDCPFLIVPSVFSNVY